MSKDWENIVLGNICNFIRGPFGGSLKKNIFKKSGYAVYEQQHAIYDQFDKIRYFIDENKFQEMKRFELKPGDLIMSCSGTMGKIAIIPEKIKVGIINQALLKLTPLSKKINTDFLKLWLQSESFQKKIEELSGGAAIKNVPSVAILKKIQIPLPPLSEQQEIVSILDDAFESIERAKLNSEKNLKNAKELFESYLQNIFEKPKDNWEKKKWGDLCHFVRGPFGGSLKKSIFKEEGYVVYEQKHAIHDHFNQVRYFIDEDKFNEMIRFELKPGDIIMSCSGSLGRVAIVPDGIKRGIINQALLKLTPKKNISVQFIKHWLRSPKFQKIIFDFSGGAAIPNVPSAKILKEILIPLPSLKEQEKIVNDIELVLFETQKLETVYNRKLNDLEELKKSILQKAFNGELKTSKISA
jgi:type I restriction enzyme S subunit